MTAKLFIKTKGLWGCFKKGINTVDSEYFCIFNADGSFDPKELNFMIDRLKHEKYDFVFASRYEKIVEAMMIQLLL